MHSPTHARVRAQSLQSCPILCNPMDCSPAGSSVHGILQVRILEWVAIFFSRGSSWSTDQACISCISRQTLYYCATWEDLSELYGKLCSPGICTRFCQDLRSITSHKLLWTKFTHLGFLYSQVIWIWIENSF